MPAFWNEVAVLRLGQTMADICTSIKSCLHPDGSPQRVVLLVGTPGAGKSTLCMELQDALACETALPRPLQRISQDELGSRKACVARMEAALDKGNNVIVDRCNFDVAQRAHWIKIAKRRGIAPIAIFLDTPNEECKRRVLQRVGHPTLGPTQQSMAVVERFLALLELPTLVEGFEQVIASHHMRREETVSAIVGYMKGTQLMPACIHQTSKV